MARRIVLILTSALTACSGPGPGPTAGGSAGGLSLVGGGFSGTGGGSGGSGGVGGGSSVGGGTAGSAGGGSAGGAVGGGASGGMTAGGGIAGGSAAGGASGGGMTAGGAAGGMVEPGGVGSFVRVGYFNQLLATGPDGRMHLTFLEGAAERVFYGSCAQNCFTDAAWSPVQLRSSAQLSVTTVGPYGIGVDSTNRVHLVVGAVTGLGSSANAIQYGTCASNCGVATSWTWTDLSSISPGRSLIGTSRTFMVRPNGAVSFFTAEGIYFTCNGACSTLSNWSAPVALNNEVLHAVVDGTGVSHALLNKGRSANNESLLGYARCASNCSVPANWQISQLGFLSNAPLFGASLSATASGRVFMAYNQGVITVSTQDNSKLFIASCPPTANCLDLNVWSSFAIGALEEGDVGAWVEAYGEGALLASTTVSTLNLYGCNQDCHLAASWGQGTIIDTSAAIAQVVPPALGSSCPNSATFAAWYPRRPTVGISPTGVAIVHNPTALVTCPGSTGPATRPPIGRIITTF
ncbi:MAG: hypothetical protein MUC96_21725 [Myxococcaceae bacterium]|nr:hypothetical protein [Myxococcaceae bacterium]